MSYTPTYWQRGDTITAEGLNNIESGVLNATHDAQISAPPTLIDVPLEAQPDVTFSFTMVDPADPSQTMTFVLVKISDEILTEDDVIGGVIGDGVHSETVTADMVVDLSEGEQYGVTGLTGISVRGMVFCISEASELVPSAGVYAPDMLIPQLDEFSFQRVEYRSVTAYPMPMYYGTDEMEDGVTDLPNDVIYMQVKNGAVTNIYVGVEGKAAEFNLSPLFDVTFTGQNEASACDRTFDEIVAAYNAGKTLRLLYVVDYYVSGGGVHDRIIELNTNVFKNAQDVITIVSGDYAEVSYDQSSQLYGAYAHCTITSSAVTCEQRGLVRYG